MDLEKQKKFIILFKELDDLYKLRDTRFEDVKQKIKFLNLIDDLHGLFIELEYNDKEFIITGARGPWGPFKTKREAEEKLFNLSPFKIIEQEKNTKEEVFDNQEM